MIMYRKLIAVLAFSLATLASSAVQAAEYKIAFVEVPRVLNESPQVEAVRSALKKEFARRDAELVAQGKQIKKLEEKLKRDGAIMSKGEATRLERDIISRRRKLKNAQSEFQEDLTLRQNEELNKLRRRISEVIEQVAKDGQFDLVLEAGVVYASKRANITDRVLQQLKAAK